jgi:uncharacterized protein (TIGR02646 family)
MISIARTNGKCAYCENALDAVEIDHYVPKTTDIENAFEWSNLFPVCGPCNRAKGNSNQSLGRPDLAAEDRRRFEEPLHS